MQKSKPVAYIAYKIRTTDRIAILDYLNHAPITDKDRTFVFDIIAGLSYKDLAVKYNMTESGVYQRKRKLFEHLYRYDMLRR